MMLKYKQLILFIIFLIFGSGCFEYEEELTLKKDGSGSIMMAYGLPLEMVQNDESFTSEKIRNDLTDIEGITVISTKEFEKNNLKWVQASAKFNSLESLSKIKSDKLPGFAGEMNFTNNGDGTFTFTKILGEKPKTNSTQKPQDLDMMKKMVGDVNWEYDISFPMNIVSANSGQGDVKTIGKNVKWSVSLANIIGGQTSLNVILGKQSKMVSLPVHHSIQLRNGSTIHGEVISLTKISCIVMVKNKRERIHRKDIQSINFFKLGEL